MNYDKEIKAFIIANFLFGDEAALTDDTSFLDSGIIDSTGVLELIAFLEQHCGVKIHEHEMVPENLDSLSRIRQFVARKLAPEPVAGIGGACEK